VTPFRIGLCQARTFGIEDPEANLQEVLGLLDEAGHAECRLVALPESSYPAYYLRDGEPYSREGVRSYDEVVALLGHYAEKYGYWLAAGLARPTRKGLANSAVIIGPDGEVRGHYDKHFLWHFDSNWFQAGKEFPVWDTGFCKFGALICADGRMPEVARSLALNGAEVILDLTAWVSSGADPATLSNPQCEYMMPVRAFENGVWVAAADKWGPEAGSIVYAGRSTVISPAGETVLCAPSEGSMVVVYDVEPASPGIVPRRPNLEMYRRLTDGKLMGDFDEALARRAKHPGKATARVSVVPSTGSFDAAKVAASFAELRAQGADLVVFGGDDGPEGWQVELPTFEKAVKELGGAMVVGVTTTGCSVHQSAVLVAPEGTHEHAATHGRGIQLGEAASPVIPTAAGWVGLMCGDEGLVPEVARGMLQTADLIAWPAFQPPKIMDALVRTRADENRLFVASAWQGGAMVAAPSGTPLAVSPRDSGIAMTATVHPVLAQFKDMAPGTNVVRNRIPGAYAVLAR
jgi:predicted amidohydrolase